MWYWLVSATAALFALTYYSFQKHLLPLWLGRWVGRLFLYPVGYPTLLIGHGLKITGNWWDPIDDYVILGSLPIVWLGHVFELYRVHGVRGVINCQDEFSGHVALYSQKGMRQLHLPTVDHEEPSVADIARAMAFIEDHKSRGEKVYIHCKAGHGRSAAIVMCYLVTQRNMELDDAQEFLLGKRRVRKRLYKQPNVLAYCTSVSSGTES